MQEKASLLKVFISENDMLGSIPLYEAIVNEARDSGMAGATVHKGVLSFGASHSKHSFGVDSITRQVPLVVELIDDHDIIRTFAGKAQDLVNKSGKGALITIQQVEIVSYKPGDKYNQFSSF